MNLIWVLLVGAAFMRLFMYWRKSRIGKGISLLVPFRCTDPEHQRAKNWRWLEQYWHAQLPGAEIIVGTDIDAELPFSKSVAVNAAAAEASGDVFVIMDADGYMDFEAVLHCAKEIRKARRKGHRLWYVPYRQFYRLTEEASERLLSSDPKRPLYFPTPPWPQDVLDTSGSQLGHWYGAGVQIMPREAFEDVGGWDPRFRGWGGEDHAAMRATDTLYWPHKTLPGQFLHVWHPMLNTAGQETFVHWKDRVWSGQSSSGANDDLSGKYYGAHGDGSRMRKLVEEGRALYSLRDQQGNLILKRKGEL